MKKVDSFEKPAGKAEGPAPGFAPAANTSAILRGVGR
jgi:hypothetical protein